MFIIIAPAMVSTCVVALISLLPNHRRLKLANPIFWLTVSTVIGCLGQALYISIFPENLPLYRFEGQHRLDDFVSYFTLLPLGIAIWAVGYLIPNFGLPIHKIAIFRNKLIWANKRIYIVNIATLIITTISSILFFRHAAQEGELAGMLFRKIEVAVAEDSYSSLGVYRWLTYPSVIVAFINFTAYTERSQFNTRIKMLSLAVIQVILYSAIPIASSVRTPILYALIGLVIIYSTLKKASTLRLAIIGLVLISSLVSLGYLRTLSQTGTISDFKVTDVFSRALDYTIGSGNGLPLFATGVIARYGPQEMGLQYGKTYAATLTGFIPRQLWPKKPSISPEAEILESIYRIPARRSGRPPGFVAEAMLNFGVLGVMLLPFIIGIIHRIYLNSFFNLIKYRNRNAIVVWTATLLYLFVNIWQLSFGLGFIAFTIVLIFSYIILSYISQETRCLSSC